jgi:dTMP kinase
MLICIEGMDASGKATQSKLLSERLQARRIAFPTYDTEPASLVGPIITSHLRENWRAEAPFGGLIDGGFNSLLDAIVFQCVMTADKYSMAPSIKAVVDYGGTVILDRYWHSGFAFGGTDGIDLPWLMNVHRALPQPDINILLDVDFETSLARRPDRRDCYEKMGKDYFENVRYNYLCLWKSLAAEHKLHGRWIVLDGREPLSKVTTAINTIIAA